MKLLRSAIALMMALLMVLSLGGCTMNKGTTWIAKSGAETIPAGLYLLNVSSGYNAAVSVLEQMYLDSFLKLACLEGESIEETFKALEAISEKYHVTFVLSVSQNADSLPECAKASVVVSL